MQRAKVLIVEDPDSDCWIWCGDVDRHGYPTFKDNGEQRSAKLAIYNTFSEDDYDACYVGTCNNKLCIRPEHIKHVVAVKQTNKETLNVNS